MNGGQDATPAGHDHPGHSHESGNGHSHSHAPKDFGAALAVGTALNVGFVAVGLVVCLGPQRRHQLACYAAPSAWRWVQSRTMLI